MITGFLKNHPGLIAVFCYLLLSVVSFRNILFVPGVIGLRDDWSIPPLATQNISQASRILYTWWYGQLINRNLGEHFGLALGTLSALFNFSGEIFSKIAPLLLIFFSGLSFYLLARDYKVKPLARLLGGLIYMFTPLTYNSVVSGYILLLISYSLLPLLFLLIKRLLGDAKINPVLIITSALTLRVIIGQDNFVLIGAIFIGTYFIYHELIDWRGWRIFVKDTISMGGVFFVTALLSAPFIIDFVSNVGQNVGQILTGGISWNTFANPTLSRALFQDGAGYRYFFASLYRDVIPAWFVVSTILLTCYLSSLFLASPKRRLEVPFYGLLIVLSIFLFKGMNPPLGYLNLFLLEKVPLVTAVLRNAQYITVLSSLSYAALGCFFLDFILLRKFSGKLKAAIVILFVAAWFVTTHPFYSGDFGKNIQLYKLDEQYSYLDQYLRSDPLEYQILLLPPSQPMSYMDSYHPGIDPLAFGLTKTAITNDGQNELQKFIVVNLYLVQDSNQLATPLAFSNVRKIISRTDFESKHLGYMGGDWHAYLRFWNNATLSRQIDNMSFLSEPESFGQNIKVYTNNLFFPLFYIPGRVITSGDPIETLLSLPPVDPAGNANSVFFTWQNPRDDRPPLDNWQMPDPAPSVEYLKINPTQYKLVIRNVSSPFPLVFSDAFDSGWSLLRDNENIQKRQPGTGQASYFGTIQSDSLTKEGYLNILTAAKLTKNVAHFKINGFANGWVIDPGALCQTEITCLKNRDGSYDLQFFVGFYPQKFHVAANLIVGATLIICALFLLIWKVKSLLSGRQAVPDSFLDTKGEQSFPSGLQLLSNGVAMSQKRYSTQKKRLTYVLTFFLFLRLFVEKYESYYGPDLPLYVLVVSLLCVTGALWVLFHILRQYVQTDAPHSPKLDILIESQLTALTSLSTRFTKIVRGKSKRVILVFLGLLLFSSLINKSTLPVPSSVIVAIILTMIIIVSGAGDSFLGQVVKSCRDLAKSKSLSIYAKKLALFIPLSLYSLFIAHSFLSPGQLFFVNYLIFMLIFPVSSQLTIIISLLFFLLMSLFPFKGQLVSSDQMAITGFTFLTFSVFQLMLEYKRQQKDPK